MVFITAAFFAPAVSLPFLALSSMCLLIPLSKKLYFYAVLCVIAVSIFSSLLNPIDILIPYILFFGIHPIITIVLQNIKLDKIIASVIKQVFFNIALIAAYFIFKELILTFPSFIRNNLVWAALFLNVFFLFYDNLFLRLCVRIDKYIKNR